MDTSEYDRIRARTDALEGQVDSMLGNYDEQMRAIAAAREQLAIATIQAWSPDNLVRVTSNAAGVPIDVWVDPQAYKRLTPQKLGVSITQAAQGAARQAKAGIADALKPVTDGMQYVIEDPLDDGDVPGTVGPVESILPPPPAPRAGQEPEYGGQQPSPDAPQQGYGQQPAYGGHERQPAHGQQPGYQKPPPSYPQPQAPEHKPSYAPAWEQDDDDQPHWKGF